MPNYIPINSFIHRLNPIVKYFFEFIVIFTLPFMHVEKLYALVIIMLVLIKLSNIPILYFHKKLKFILYILLFLILFTFIYPNFTIISACLISLRIYIIFAIIVLITMTTRITELLSIFNLFFNKFLSEDTAMKFTYIVFLIIKFIPLLFNEIDKIFLSLRTRGLSLKRGNIKKKFSVLKIFVFTLVRKIDHIIDEYDLVLHARNITYKNMSNMNLKLTFKKIDVLHLVIIIVFVLI